MIKKYFIFIIFSFFFFSYPAFAEENYTFNSSIISDYATKTKTTYISDNSKTIYENLEERINYYNEKGYNFILSFSSVSPTSDLIVYFIDNSIDISNLSLSSEVYTFTTQYFLKNIDKPIKGYKCTTTLSDVISSCDNVFNNSSSFSIPVFINWKTTQTYTYSGLYYLNFPFKIGNIEEFSLFTSSDEIVFNSSSSSTLYKYLVGRNYITNDFEEEINILDTLKQKYTSGFNDSLVPTFFSLIAHIVGVCIVIIALVKALQFFFILLKKG